MNTLDYLAHTIALSLLLTIGPCHAVVAVLGGIADHTLQTKLLPVLLKRRIGHRLFLIIVGKTVPLALQ